MHELTHAWQIEHYGLPWYGAQALDNQVISDDAYSYKCDPTKKLSDYNAEQQAEIVKDYYLGKECPTSVARSLRSDTWKLMIGSDALDLSIAADGSLYMVNSAGKIYRYQGVDWQQLTGRDGRAIAANANQVVLVNSAGKIYRLKGEVWQQLPVSDAKDVAIDSDGAIWMVNSAGLIYRLNGNSWQQMPGSDAARIAAGGGRVWLVNTAGRIYSWTGGQWTVMPGSDARDSAVANDGAVYLTNNAGKIYQWNNGSWQELDGSDGVTLAANAHKLIMANTRGRIYIRNGV